MTYKYVHTRDSEEQRIDVVQGWGTGNDFFLAFLGIICSLWTISVIAFSYLEINYVLYYTSPDLYDMVTFNPELSHYFPKRGVMLFYAIWFLAISLNMWVFSYWNVGSGFDLFDKKKRIVYFFRYGIPGKNSRILIEVPMDDIDALVIQSKIENTKYGSYVGGGVLYIRTRKLGFIPLSPIYNYWSQDEIVQKTLELRRFLVVPIKMKPV